MMILYFICYAVWTMSFLNGIDRHDFPGEVVSLLLSYLFFTVFMRRVYAMAPPQI